MLPQEIIKEIPTIIRDELSEDLITCFENFCENEDDVKTLISTFTTETAKFLAKAENEFINCIREEETE